MYTAETTAVPVVLLEELQRLAEHASRLLGYVDAELLSLAVTGAILDVDNLGRILAERLGRSHGFGGEPAISCGIPHPVDAAPESTEIAAITDVVEVPSVPRTTTLPLPRTATRHSRANVFRLPVVERPPEHAAPTLADLDLSDSIPFEIELPEEVPTARVRRPSFTPTTRIPVESQASGAGQR